MELLRHVSIDCNLCFLTFLFSLRQVGREAGAGGEGGAHTRREAAAAGRGEDQALLGNEAKGEGEDSVAPHPHRKVGAEEGTRRAGGGGRSPRQTDDGVAGVAANGRPGTVILTSTLSSIPRNIQCQAGAALP